MNALFCINTDSLTNKISYYHLLFLLISLPFDFFYSHLIIISFAVHTLLNVKKDRFKLLFSWRVLLLQSVFWLSMLGMMYTRYKNEAGDELGRRLVILLMPVLLCLTPLNLKKYRQPLMICFALACTATVVYLYADALHTIRYYHYPLRSIFSPAFTNHNFSNPIGMHATFFSMQLGLALVCLLLVLVKETALSRQIFLTLCCAVLLAGLVQLSSKSVWVSLLIVLNFVVPVFALSGKKRLRYMVACIAVTVLSAFAISGSAAFKERYFTDLEKDLSQPHENETLDPRLARWETALHLAGQSPVVGYGSGSEIPLLKDAYFERKLYSSFLNGLNAHNEYLSMLLKLGIAGLLVYLLTLAFGFKTAIKLKDALFLTFMLLVLIVSVSENVLDVDKGTMFFGLFFPLFLFSGKQQAIRQQ